MGFLTPAKRLEMLKIRGSRIRIDASWWVRELCGVTLLRYRQNSDFTTDSRGETRRWVVVLRYLELGVSALERTLIYPPQSSGGGA